MIAIALINNFPPGVLPDLEPRTYADSDKARFENAWNAALTVDFYCAQPRPTALGWTHIGKKQSLCLIREAVASAGGFGSQMLTGHCAYPR